MYDGSSVGYLMLIDYFRIENMFVSTILPIPRKKYLVHNECSVTICDIGEIRLKFNYPGLSDCLSVYSASF